MLRVVWRVVFVVCCVLCVMCGSCARCVLRVVWCVLCVGCCVSIAALAFAGCWPLFVGDCLLLGLLYVVCCLHDVV